MIKVDFSLSVIVPVMNESANIKDLFEEIKRVCDQVADQYEIIIVDDGSTDDSREIYKSLHPSRIVRFDRNYGQTAALACGFSLAAGDLVVSIDGDGQNVPDDIAPMIGFLSTNDLDVVCGWRKNRKDNLYRRSLMWLAYLCRQIFLHDGIHDSGCTLKVFKRETLDGLILTDGQHRFIPAVLQKRGSRVGEMVVSHRPRVFGRSKYSSSSRVFRGFQDMFSLKAGRAKREPVHYVIKEIVEY